MKNRFSSQKTSRNTDYTSVKDASAGPNSIAMSPPDYGIDFVDGQNIQMTSQNKQSAISDIHQIEPDTSLATNEVSYLNNPKVQRLDQATKFVMQPSEGNATNPTQANGSDFLANNPANVQTTQAQPLQFKIDFDKTQETSDTQPMLQMARPLGQMAENPGDVHKIAQGGVQGRGHKLPYSEKIQKSFGKHDISQVQSYTNSKASSASQSIGAEAYTTGNKIAFANTSPTLYTAAHEAAHVIQQGAGVQLKDGVGRVGDKYERHADAVAAKVSQGRSAETLLNNFQGGSKSSSGPMSQSQAVQKNGIEFAGRLYKPDIGKHQIKFQNGDVDIIFPGVDLFGLVEVTNEAGDHDNWKVGIIQTMKKWEGTVEYGDGTTLTGSATDKIDGNPLWMATPTNVQTNKTYALKASDHPPQSQPAEYPTAGSKLKSLMRKNEFITYLVAWRNPQNGTPRVLKSVAWGFTYMINFEFIVEQVTRREHWMAVISDEVTGIDWDKTGVLYTTYVSNVRDGDGGDQPVTGGQTANNASRMR